VSEPAHCEAARNGVLRQIREAVSGDGLSMLKVDGQWSIVHKTFYAHPAR
jgi:hypothetical protein